MDQIGYLENTVKQLSTTWSPVTISCEGSKVEVPTVILNNNIKSTCFRIKQSALACILVIQNFYFNRLHTDDELCVELQCAEFEENARSLIVPSYLEAYDLANFWGCSSEVLLRLKNKIKEFINVIDNNLFNSTIKSVLDSKKIETEIKLTFITWLMDSDLGKVRNKSLKIIIKNQLSEEDKSELFDLYLTCDDI